VFSGVAPGSRWIELVQVRRASYLHLSTRSGPSLNDEPDRQGRDVGFCWTISTFCVGYSCQPVYTLCCLIGRVLGPFGAGPSRATHAKAELAV
jgi:hypothetical protein